MARRNHRPVPFPAYLAGALPILCALAALAAAPPGSNDRSWDPPIARTAVGDSIERSSDRIPTRPAVGDSADLRNEARRAQAAFERLRVQNLPWSWGGGWGTQCDERIGRMCIRHGRDFDWEPPPEEEDTRAAREDLIRTLEEIAREIPGDDWVLGQRVRYLGEADRWPEAEVAARECAGASPWWCLALEGYVHHHRERFEEAALAFDAALEEMDPERGEEWRDLERLLDVDGYRFIRNRSGEERRAVEERVWILANPLLLVPGNDRRTAHFARHVAAEVREDARNPYNLRWSRDLAEITVRYGDEYGWQKERPRPGHVGPPPVTGRFHPRSRGFLPPGSVLRDPAGLEPGEWTADERRTRARYAPSYAPRVHAVHVETAVFHRRDSVEVVAAWELPEWIEHEDADPESPPDGPFRAGLFLIPAVGDGVPATDNGSAGEHPFRELEEIREGRAVPAARAPADRRGVLRVAGPAGGHVVSTEVMHAEAGKAWRARHGLRRDPPVPGTPALSDLLLTEPVGDAPARTLDDVWERALPRFEAEAGGAVGVAWELYGLEGNQGTVRFRATLEREDRGVLRRAGEWLRLVEPEPPVVVTWSEPIPEEEGPFFRAVDLDLQGLDPGTYRLRLEADPSGQSAVTAERRLRVLDPE